MSYSTGYYTEPQVARTYYTEPSRMSQTYYTAPSRMSQTYYYTEPMASMYEEPMEEESPRPLPKKNYGWFVVSVVAAFFALYQLGLVIFGLDVAAMLMEHAIIHQLTASSRPGAKIMATSLSVMLLVYITSAHKYAFLMSACIVMGAWAKGDPKSLYGYLPLWLLLVVAAVHAFCLNPLAQRAAVPMIEKGLAVGWLVGMGVAIAAVGVAIFAAFAVAVPWLPIVGAWLMTVTLSAGAWLMTVFMWAVKHWLKAVESVVGWLKETQPIKKPTQTNHGSTQTERCVHVSVGVQTDAVKEPQANSVSSGQANRVMQMFKRHFEYCKIKDSRREMRQIVDDVETAIGKTPDEKLVSYMREAPEKVNPVLCGMLPSMIAGRRHTSEGWFRHVAFVFGVEDQARMDVVGLKKATLRKIHPDKKESSESALMVDMCTSFTKTANELKKMF